MGGTYTIYAYFNQEQIQSVLNAIVMLVGAGGTDGDYLSLLRIAAMLGLFLAVTLGFVRARGEDAAQYLIMVAIFYSTLFVPRVTVTIEEVSGSGGAPVVVDHVPLGLAFFASTTSHIGHWLTEKTETFFALPDTELQLSHHGLMGGARALREAQNADLSDPVLSADLVSFMRDCINPELLNSPSTINSLMQSTNLWQDFNDLTLINPGRMVSLLSVGTTVGCDTAYTTSLPARMNPAVTSTLQRVAQIISPNSTPAAANTAMASMLPSAEAMIMTASASAAESIKQRMLINMMNDTSSNLAQIMNDPAAAQTALGASMASSSANSAYRITAKLASETLPIIRNAIELVIIGVFPIMLILIIIAGTKGGVVLRSYVMTMLWLQLWAPMYAIVNFVGTMAHAKSAKAALGGIDGLAIANAAAFANATISSEAVVGILTISVPMIALALVKGGEVAMSGVVSSVTGGASSAASRAGEAVGTGNISLGNTSWGNGSYNNTNANKMNTDGQIFSGAMQTRDENANVFTDTPKRTTVQAPTNSGALTQGHRVAGASQLQEIAAKQRTEARTSAVSSGNESIAALTQAARWEKSATDMARVSDAHAQIGAIAKDQKFGTNYDGTTNAGTNSRMTNTNAARLNVGVNLPGAGGRRMDAIPDPSAKPEPGKPSQHDQQIFGAGAKPQPSPEADKALGKLGAMAKVAKALGVLDAGIAKNFGAEWAKVREFGTAEQVKEGASILYGVSENAQRTHNEAAEKSGGTGTGSGIDAKLTTAAKHLESAETKLSDAESNTLQASRMRSEERSTNYDALADGDGRQYVKTLGAVRNSSPEQRGDTLRSINGDAPPLSDTYLDGSRVKGREELKAQHEEHAKKIPNTTAGVYAGYVDKVPGHGAGGKPLAGMNPEAPAQFSDALAKMKNAQALALGGRKEQLENAAINNQNKMGFETTNPNSPVFDNPASGQSGVSRVIMSAATDSMIPMANAAANSDWGKYLQAQTGYTIRQPELTLGTGFNQKIVGNQETSVATEIRTLVGKESPPPTITSPTPKSK